MHTNILQMFMHIHMSTLHTYMYTNTYIDICIYSHIYICMCIYIYIHVYVNCVDSAAASGSAGKVGGYANIVSNGSGSGPRCVNIYIYLCINSC